jgi:hypothetical protein
MVRKCSRRKLLGAGKTADGCQSRQNYCHVPEYTEIEQKAKKSDSRGYHEKHSMDQSYGPGACFKNWPDL